MNDWLPYQDVQAERGLASADGTVVCGECQKSFPLDEVIRLGERHICAACKPLAIQKMQEGNADGHDEEIRQEHIKHEASIRSVRILYFLPAFFLIIGGLGMFAGGEGEPLAMGAVFLGLGALCFFRCLWYRQAQALVAYSGRHPLGNRAPEHPLRYVDQRLHPVALLLEERHDGVFRRVPGIIERTPHIKHKTPILVVVLGVLIIALLAGALVFGLTAGG